MQFGIKGKHKTDQETQSPVLKIFTDMLARDKFTGYRDPEKAALLRAEHKRDRDKKDDRREERREEERKNKKKKGKKRSTNQKSDLKSKELAQKVSCHCYPNKKPKKKDKSSSSKEEREEETRREVRISNMDKKDVASSVGSLACEPGKKRMSDDTCSCASCVLKKMCRNDCICCCCVTFVFLLSLLLAFLLVCRSVPCLRGRLTALTTPELESDRLKRKIDVPADLQWDANDKKSRHSPSRYEYERIPSHPVPHSMDTAAYEDLSVARDSELTKIFDSDKLNDIQSSERLREFYKKLVATDAQIRQLKKKDYMFNMENTDLPISYPDRVKRSLNIFRRPFKFFGSKKTLKDETTTEKLTEEPKLLDNKLETTEASTKEDIAGKTKEVTDRKKRFDDNEDGLLIEKKKVSIQFMPNIRRTFKCNHAPKEVNSYEKPIKHPFYQNTQRLDELLDKFLDKNVMEIMQDPYSRSLLSMKKCKHNKAKVSDGKETTMKVLKAKTTDFMLDADNKNKDSESISYKNKQIDERIKLLDEQINKSKMIADRFNKNKQQSSTDSVHEFLEAHGGFKAKAKATTTSVGTKLTKEDMNKENPPTTINYNLVMSISTMMYRDKDYGPPKKTPEAHKVKERSVGRRLMQIEMEDEELPVEAASERDGERKKRRDEDPNPNSLINPNWKGAMPLYPDELNSIFKPGPLIINKDSNHLPAPDAKLVPDPKENKVIKGKSPMHRSATEKDVADLSDIEYIEDYFRNKYDRLVDMAQAYSDYGVLDDTKSRMNNVDERMKLKMEGRHQKLKSDSAKQAMLLGLKGSKDTTTDEVNEGFKMELVPSKSYFEGVFKTLKKHFQDSFAYNDTNDTSPPAVFAVTEQFKTSKSDPDVLDIKDITKIDKPDENLAENIEYRTYKKRSLKTVDDYESVDEEERDAIESLMNFRGIFTGLTNKFHTKLGSAQDYALRVASDYIHDSIYKRDVEQVNDTMLITDEDFANLTDATVIGIDRTANKTDATAGIGDGNATANITDIAMKLVTKDGTNKSAKSQAKDSAVKTAAGGANDTVSMISDFFLKLADWFTILDAMNMNDNASQAGNFSAPNKTSTETPRVATPSPVELSFPLYDADMIENIGHRSRVLMSVNQPDGDGLKKTGVDSSNQGEMDSINQGEGDSVIQGEVDSLNQGEVDNLNQAEGDSLNQSGLNSLNQGEVDNSNQAEVDSTTDGEVEEGIGKATDNTTATNQQPNNSKNNSKVIVKRNADSNLLFWDDVYDEYGDADVADDDKRPREAAATASDDLLKKPKANDWLSKIVHRFKNMEKPSAKECKDCEKCKGVKIDSDGKAKTPDNKMKYDFEVNIPTSQKTSRRFYRKADPDDLGEERKTDFVALTAKMKKICQKAAKDISLSKKLEVREESKEGQVASKLMQQLVALMGDLVDYQVHEKTCRKLPADLQTFLEWLTNPDSSAMTYHARDFTLPDRVGPLEEIRTLDALPGGEREDKPDTKSDCLGTIQAVRDLLARYSRLSDDDKSKMSGVKEYLENQMEYLQRQLYMTNDYNIYNPDISRYKRNVDNTPCDKQKPKPRNRIFIQTIQKYVATPGKHNKHNKKKLNKNKKKKPTTKNVATTIRQPDRKTITIGVKVTEKSFHSKLKPMKEDKVLKKVTKRNLRDVFYRALEEAKLTTVATSAKSIDY